MLNILLETLIIGMMIRYLTILIKDLCNHRKELKDDPGSPILISIYSVCLYFLSTFGFPDFAISSALLPLFGWAEGKKLPGTLNNESALPVTFMALGYMTMVKLPILNLVLPIIAQVLGAYLSPRFIVKLPAKRIKQSVAVGLLCAGVLLMLNKMNLLSTGGNIDSLHGWKLFVCTIFAFVCGILNNLGIGSFSIMLVILYSLGMRNLAAYPIVMGTCAFSTPTASIEFIKYNSYSRKIALLSTVFGTLGVIVALFTVQMMDLSLLQWIVCAVLIFSAIHMFRDSLRF